MSSVKCNKCGTDLDTNNIQCPNCGAINFEFDASNNNETLSTPSSNYQNENKEENIEISQPSIKEPKKETTNFNNFNQLANYSINSTEELKDNLKVTSNESSNSNLFTDEKPSIDIDLNLTSNANEESDELLKIPSFETEETNHAASSTLSIEENNINNEVNNQENNELSTITSLELEKNNHNEIPLEQDLTNSENNELTEQQTSKIKETNLSSESKNIIKEEDNNQNKNNEGIKCSNCSKEVSKTSKKCPNCGNRLKSNKGPIIALLTFFIVLIAVVILIVNYSKNSNSNKFDINTETKEESNLENNEINEETTPVPESIQQVPVCNESAKQLRNEYYKTIEQRDAEYDTNYQAAEQEIEKERQLLENAGGYLSQSEFNDQYSQLQSDSEKKLLETRYNMSINYEQMVNKFNELPTIYENWKNTYTEWYQQELKKLGC